MIEWMQISLLSFWVFHKARIFGLEAVETVISFKSILIIIRFAQCQICHPNLFK